MFCRNISWFICLFVAAVLATAHDDSRSITGSDSEVTVHDLTTENTVSPTRGADQEVKLTSSVDLGALLDAGDGAMVTFVAGDTRLVLHRAVLVARSPVFAAMLQGTDDQVDAPAVEGPVLRQLVAYLYTGRAPQLPGMAPQLLAVADDYGLPALKDECARQVAAQLSVETAADTAVLAIRHSSSSLRRAALAFIRAHIFHVMASQGWADAVITQPEILTNVTRLLSDLPAEASSPAPADSGATPAAQPPSDSPTPASAVTTTPARPTPSPDYAAICPLWRLPAEEKGNRLREAAMEGAVEEVGALLTAGADVGATDENRMTALHYGVGYGHVEVARRLLAAGAAVDAKDSWQWTPLHLAAKYGHTAVVRLLVAASADVNARQRAGWTPLHLAAYNDRADAATALLEAGADKGARDIDGQTPLDLARQHNHQQLVDILTSR